MDYSNKSSRLQNQRLALLEKYKKDTPIGIFGSFYKTRKEELLLIRNFLSDYGYSARISEDLDPRTDDEKQNDDPRFNRVVSEKLIIESQIHIFVLIERKDGEPDNLIQSASMELERLYTLNEQGRIQAKHVIICFENNLRETCGSLLKGMVANKEGDWDHLDYNTIEETLIPLRQFCNNSIQEKYQY